ncbi:hypothetical protein CRG98_030684 [Punica granatum]|uniref:Uncharacterized protein n=1 Tax=Punica granatum TaxID=22663 RepID=A0A2I0IY25_PUNGR|nr:hypothetical protein CRG98_030684 [Punica granatum]
MPRLLVIIALALGTMTHLVLVESDNRGWFTHKGLELRDGTPTYPVGQGIIAYRSSCWCLLETSGAPFSKASVRGLPGAPVGRVRAYRDVLNDTLAAISVVRHACRLGILLIGVPYGGCVCNPARGFLSRFGQTSI